MSHLVVSVGVSIKVGCDMTETCDVPVMCQQRQVFAGKKVGKEIITEGGAMSQMGTIHLCMLALG